MAVTSQGIDLKQSRVTQVVNDVEIISAADQKEKLAAVNDIFSMPDILRTGASSRAELVAQDETVTRVGANTVFSFDPGNRTIDLKQGSLLFHAPHGKGGGNIHTGSATASVLGTTLIITTTPNGGFKVIALEGQVEVRFLNGLKQKLNPGQMTFILPGANQLAPVVIFRLDELIEHSLLVKGFAQTLQSLPLIQNEMNYQLKQIHSGKLADTGYYAGNNATPDQVEVLDVNTISHGQQNNQPPPPPPPPPGTPPQDADATINQPSLTDSSVPTPPNHIVISQPFTLADNAFFGSQSFVGFVARNIYVNTLGAPVLNETTQPAPAARNDSAPLTVDLSPYAKVPAFAMVAVNDFSIEGSVLFSGLAPGGSLELAAGDQFFFTPGISLTAEAQNFTLASPATLAFDYVALQNPLGNVTLNSAAEVAFQDYSQVSAAENLTINAAGNITANDSQFSVGAAFFSALDGVIAFDNTEVDASGHSIFIAPAGISLNNSLLNSSFVTLNNTGLGFVNINDTTINAPSSIVIASVKDIYVTGSGNAPANRAPQMVAGGSALNADPVSGSVTLSSANGSINISGTSISAHYLTLNSGDGILLDGAGHMVAATGAGATANFTAANQISVRNIDFTPFAVVNMAANTIVLVNDLFSSSGVYDFGTHTGSVVINGQNPGGLAIINSKLDGQAITGADVTSGRSSAPGIHSYAY